ncbi:MAG: formylglycine-generating enzyme family protein [Acidobacteriota bacterium]|nr:formylglycine-generating enzyme family protein [Acidobacteriota bacterium]
MPFILLLLAAAVFVAQRYRPWEQIPYLTASIQPEPVVEAPIEAAPAPPEPDAVLLSAATNALEAGRLPEAKTALAQLRDAGTPVPHLETKLAGLFVQQFRQVTEDFNTAAREKDLEKMRAARDQMAVLDPEEGMPADWDRQIADLEAARARDLRIVDLQLQVKQFIEDRQFFEAEQALIRLARLNVDIREEMGRLVRIIKLPGGLSLKLRWIPPGTFTMGSPEDEVGRRDDEVQHEVFISRGFWLGETEVTQAQWQSMNQIVNAGNKGPENPLENVSWREALDALLVLNNVTGKKFRLPTEAEWEYACRAGTTTPFTYGETLEVSQANFDGRYPYGNGPKGEYREKTLPVGSLIPNAWGLYDMHGNVWEWCLDRYAPYEKGPLTDPVGGLSFGKIEYVLRGGGWGDFAETCRSACRFKYSPRIRVSNVGFRILMEPD